MMVQFAFDGLPIRRVRLIEAIQSCIAVHEEDIGNRSPV